MGKTDAKRDRKRRTLRAAVRKAYGSAGEYGWCLHEDGLTLHFLADELRHFGKGSNFGKAIRTLELLPTNVSDLMLELEHAVDVVLENLRRN